MPLILPEPAGRWVYHVVLCWPEFRPDVALRYPDQVLGADSSAAGSEERIVMSFASRELQEVPVPMDRNG
jgi:hypothetical protein